MNDLNKIKVWQRLYEQKGLGLTNALKLINSLGDPINYIGKKNEQLNEVSYIHEEIKSSLQKDIDPANWKKIVNYIETKPDFKFLCILDDDYPEALKHIYHPPLALTAFGDISLLKSEEIISVVGTRKPTHYGKYMCEKIINSLVINNYITCSGLALGIDSIVHKKTIEYDGSTIAVMAGGLDSIYPPQNRELANKIIQKGLVLSENFPFTHIEKYHFPQRNRIVSGLSKAVCIIEGNLKSGALITAKYALEQNKEVYALPGDITKPEALGPNFLIQKGAKIMLSPKDIVNDFNVDYIPVVQTQKIELTETEAKIYDLIKESTEIHIDLLAIQTGMSISELSSILFMLEMKDAVKTTDSGKYIIL